MNQKSTSGNHEKSFLQSEDWLRFQEAAGHEVVRITDGDVSVGGIIHELPFAGKYLYAPRFTFSGAENGEKRMENLFAEARKHGCGWVRVEPGSEDILEYIKTFVCHPALDAESRDSGLPRIFEDKNPRNDNGKGNEKKSTVCGLKTVHAPHDMQPKETFVVDIAKSEEELFAAMKSKTRYNIRLAEKKGVRVFQSADEKYRTAFVDLVAGTANRKGIVPHPRKYYETMLETLLGEGGCVAESCGFSGALFIAEHDGDILGINFMVYFGDTATYLHGGSSDAKREYMAPFLLQWEAMREAKRRGCSFYDFGGVKTANSEQRTVDKHHPSSISHPVSSDWAGITRFKTGFSPHTAPVVFPGCYDVVLSPARYVLYMIFSFIRSQLSAAKKAVGLR